MDERLWTMEELAERCGTVLSTWDCEVDRTSIRMFARAVGYTGPIYFDLEAARAAGHPDLPMPPGMTPLQIWVPGEVRLPTPITVAGTTKRLNGGNDMISFADGYQGPYRGSHWLHGVYERQGSLGRMCITESEYRFELLDGTPNCAKTHTSICY